MKKFLIALLAFALLFPGALAESTESAQAAAGFESLTNAQLGLTLKYPSGWNSNPGTSTICFLEPMTSGSVGGRMAVTVKTVSSALSSSELEDQLTAYSGSVSTLYSSFNVTELTTDSQFMNTRAASLLYTADSNGVSVSGFVTMACINKHIYAFHFSCPTDSFDSMSETIKTLRDGVVLLNAES